MFVGFDIIRQRFRLVLALACLLTCVATHVSSAPVVVIPGEGAGYIYYSAGGSDSTAPATPVEDPTLVGQISAFVVTPLPDNWLECRGQTVSAATYPALVKYLTGSDTAVSAVMPNLRGYFLRGVNTTASGLDAGRTLGSAQADSFETHTHTGTTANAPAMSGTAQTTGGGGHGHSIPVGTDTSDGGPKVRGGGNYATSGTAWVVEAPNHTHSVTLTFPAHGHTFTTAAKGGTETRPSNIAVIYAMRAK